MSSNQDNQTDEDYNESNQDCTNMEGVKGQDATSQMIQH